MSGAFVFIESTDFTGMVKHYFGSDLAYAEFQNDLAAQPDRGAVIPGAAPLRKIRWSDRRRGMGKRGGLRVIYIHIPEVSLLFLWTSMVRTKLMIFPSTTRRCCKPSRNRLCSN